MDREALIGRLHGDRVLAHEFLFPHRHPFPSAPYHRRLIEMFHSADNRVLFMVFREGAKTTVTEEGIVVAALFRDFRNCVIISSNFDRAVERLEAVKHELDHTEEIEYLFGKQQGDVWQVARIILKNGVIIHALGRQQSLRGVKYLSERPDLMIFDDIEARDDVRTPEARQEIEDWIFKDALPAGNRSRLKVRLLGTPTDPDSIVMRAKRWGWKTLEVPIEYLDGAGERQPSWVGRDTIESIDAMKDEYLRAGNSQAWDQEYMLRPISEGTRVFKQEMFRVEPRVRRWEATYAMVDPARTVRSTSATTGWAVWSWLRNRLIVWEAGADLLLPDEIVSLCFRLGGDWSPIWLGVEEDGLNEFLLQPLRHEQARRGVSLPIRAVRAPRNKLGFIRGLQPFFAAREVILAADFPNLAAQLLSFPTGRIDAPNALAYALPMRPGQAIYDGFTEDSIAPELDIHPGRPVYLVANATNTVSAMLLVQFGEGQLRVVWDGVCEGDPGEVAADLALEAGLFASRPLRAIAPAHHWERYANVGLVQALQGVPLEVSRGAAFAKGRGWLRDRIGRQVRGMPAVCVSDTARWVLNALFGGYCRALDKRGALAEFAEEGAYRVLMEGLEAAAGLMAGAEGEDVRHYDHTREGRAYLSARAR